jgi:hypothetical protein
VDDVKPGWKTSEWWTTMIGQVLNVLALVSVVSFSDVQMLTQTTGGMVSAAFMFSTNALTLIHYIQGRVKLKGG